MTDDEDGNYIVLFKDGLAEDERDSVLLTISALDEASDDNFRGRAIANIDVGPRLHGFFFKGTAESAMRLENEAGIDSVAPDAPIHVLENLPFWHQDRVDQASMPLDREPYSPDYTGEGQTIFVLDTGLREDHVEFRGRVLPFHANFADFATSFRLTDPRIFSEPATDLNGHGTHVASLAAGSSVGIAPQANIVAVKVLPGSRDLPGHSGCLIQAIQWVTEQVKTNPFFADPAKGVVINLSLTAGGVRQLPQYRRVLRAATDSGIIVTVSAGNDNNNACNRAPAGVSRDVPGVITVGATQRADFPVAGIRSDLFTPRLPNEADRDYKTAFSDWGPCVDVYAPGQNMVGAWFTSPTQLQALQGYVESSLFSCFVPSLPSSTLLSGGIFNAEK